MPSRDLRDRWWYSSRLRLGIAVLVGIVVGGIVAAREGSDVAALLGGDAGAVVYCLWVFFTTRRLDGQQTCALATEEDPGRAAIDGIVLLACLGALGAVAEILIRSKSVEGSRGDLLAGVGALSVACAWALVHTLFTLRYARLYYADTPGGIDFNADESPRYGDFAYLAFTVGMTFQVSDTAISDREIRRVVLHHALLAYLFGTVFVATTINLVAGLGK